MTGDDCDWIETAKMKYAGDTADGRPWYKVQMKLLGFVAV